MAQQPIGAVVTIFGTQEPVLGASCEHHKICGTVLRKDALIRFEKRLFEIDDNEYKEFVVARWVTDGVARCVVGRVGSSNRELLQQLEGRIAQVVQVFSKSKAPNKKAYSKANGGVCLAVLVDRYTPGDELINQHLSLMDSDSE